MPSAIPPSLQVWHIPTVSDAATLKKLTALLSPIEQQRTQQTLMELPRQTYITSHAALRMILGRQLQQVPSSLDIVSDTDGKPGIKNMKGLQFNLSHTRDYALLGVSEQCRVGIDIELIKPSRDIMAIAKRFFSESEYRWLTACDDEQRHALFYQLWCHKEAYLKALGVGLQGGLSTISLSQEDLNNTCTIQDDRQQQWWVHRLEVAPDFRAAVAVDCPDVLPAVQHWHIKDFL